MQGGPSAASLALTLWEIGGEIWPRYSTLTFLSCPICARDANQPSNCFHSIVYKAHNSVFPLGYAALAKN